MTEPRKRKSAAVRRAEIVDTAIRLSAEIGPDRVTTQHLADAVGVTQPAIFRHFATKADIWMAVADHIVGEMGSLHSHMAHIEGSNPHDTLLHVVGHHFTHVTQNPAIPAILFSRELHAENENLRNKFSALMSERRAALVELLKHAQEAGIHRAEIVAEDAAHLIMAALQGMSMRWALEDRGFDLVDEGGRVLSSLINGMRA